MKTTLLKIDKIVSTAGTQIRARIDVETVDQYAEAMQDAKTKFPPVVVFHDGSQYILADGFHRVMAASRNGTASIQAEIRKGTKSDALRFALGANATHGLKRTNADKRRSVVLALEEWPKLSDREIARICAVGAPMVGDVRNCNNITVDQPTTRIGADGKERRMPIRTPKPQPSEQFIPEPEVQPEETASEEPPHIRSADEISIEQAKAILGPVDTALREDELRDVVLEAFHRLLKPYSASELPIVRNILRAELKLSEKHDLQ